MASKIYTKTGDLGKTSLFGGARLSKDDVRIEAYGTVDELNASVGYLSELLSEEDLLVVLTFVQNKLFNIGSQLAMDPSKSFDMPGVTNEDVEYLEKQIDRMEATLPELKNFILPSGNRPGAYAHVTRTICRRAERRVVTLQLTQEIDTQIVVFLNRLSDCLFSISRYIVNTRGDQERIWDPGTPN